MNHAVSAHSASAANRNRSLFLLTGLALGYFIVLLDTTIMTVALPAIRQDLGGGINGLTWVTNAYTMIFASLLLGMGSMSDRFGAKRIFLIGLVTFAAASIFSVGASSLGILIVFRAFLGIGGAALLPSALTIIAHTFSDPVNRTRALSIFAAVSGAALAAGPVLGGILVDSLGWRSIFLLNVPISVIGYFLVRGNLIETPRRKETGFDSAGQLTGMLGIAAITFAIMEGGEKGWSSPLIVSSFGSAFALAFLFIRIQKRSASPMLPLVLFRNAVLSSGMAAGFIVNFGMSGILFVMTLYFQSFQGHSAAYTGFAFLALTLPMAVIPLLMSKFVGRYGAAVPIGSGFMLEAAGMLILASLPVNVAYAVTGPALFLIGSGTALVLPALVSSVIAAAPRETAGVASGALNAIRQLGATLGVAIFGLVLESHSHFADGLRWALTVACLLCVGGSYLAFRFIGYGGRTTS